MGAGAESRMVNSPTAMAQTTSPPVGSTVPRTVALGLVTACLAALAVLAPAIALALVAVVGVTAMVSARPIGQLGRTLAAFTVAAAVAGPNLALPQAPEIYGFRVLIVLLLLGVIAHMALGGTIPWSPALNLPVALMGLMLVWSAASIIWADQPTQVLRWTGLLLLGMALSVMIAVAFGTRERMIVLLKILGAVFVVVVAVSLIELVAGIRLPTSRLAGRAEGTTFATTSFFGNENNLATYLTLMLPYFLGLVIVFRDIRLRTIGVAGGVTTLLLLLYTGSKTNLVVTALVLLTFFVALAVDRSTRKQAFVGALAVAVATALVLVPALNGVGPVRLPQQALSKFSFSLLTEQVNTGVGSGAVRASLLSDGVGVVRDSGGVGVGAGNSSEAIAAATNFPEVVLLLHNWWLEVAVNLGLIGLALYVSLYAFLVRRQLRAVRSADPFIRYLGLAGAAALIGFIMGSLAPSSALAFSPMWIIFGVCLGTVVLMSARQRGQT